MDERLNELHLQQKLQESRMDRIEQDAAANKEKEEEFRRELYQELRNIRDGYKDDINTLKESINSIKTTADKWMQRIFGGVVAVVFLYILLQYGLDEFLRQLLLRIG